MNDIYSQACLVDVLRRINDQPATQFDELLPWNWLACLRLAQPIMAAPSHVFTISFVAEIFGEDKDWLHKLSSKLPMPKLSSKLAS